MIGKGAVCKLKIMGTAWYDNPVMTGFFRESEQNPGDPASLKGDFYK